MGKVLIVNGEKQSTKALNQILKELEINGDTVVEFDTYRQNPHQETTVIVTAKYLGLAR